MKVRELIKALYDLNPEANVFVSTGTTFDDVSDFTLTWGGPNSADGESKQSAKFVYINITDCDEDEKEYYKIKERPDIKFIKSVIDYTIDQLRPTTTPDTFCRPCYISSGICTKPHLDCMNCPMHNLK